MTQITPVEEAVRDFPLMNTEDLQSLDIPLKKLIAWNENVRRTNADEGIEELAASIASHGLLQSLVVRKEPRGKYAVVAGRRRLRALSLLVSTGAVPDTLEIPCRLTTNRYADLTEISLAENVVRQDMHPADQFEAFQRLIANGKTVTAGFSKKCNPKEYDIDAEESSGNRRDACGEARDALSAVRDQGRQRPNRGKL